MIENSTGATPTDEAGNPSPRYGTVDRDYAMTLATTAPADDGPVWMVNLMKYRERADYADGRSTDISGQEADDLYSPLDSLAAVGAEPVFFADVDTQLLGEPAYDRIGIVKYPTRKSFIDMQSLPTFIEKHPHKEAGMEQTFVIGCQPLPSPEPAEGWNPPDWADVPHPPTDDDGPVVVMHVIRFEENEAVDTPGYDHSAADDMATYQRHAAEVAGPHGVRIDAWLAVEGTIVGDGRQWHQVRFNTFPSKAAFMAVVTDPARLEAQKNHREKAMADSITTILRPGLNMLNQSINGAD